MSSEKVKIEEGLYIIKFGWVISGRTTNQRNERHQENIMFIMTHSSSDIISTIHSLTSVERSLHAPPDIDEFWKLETIGITPPGKIKEDDAVMEHFKNTAVKVDGRYQVTWPWIDEDVKPPENYELSLGRLKSLYRRLVEDPELLKKYDNIIEDQLSKSIIEEINESEEEGQNKHYIPHHGVITPDRDTTKVRIVFDASAKTKKSNLSLNECLHRRPVILEDLCGLLIRFRTKKIGIVADIEKAFLQVAVQQKDRDVIRFLWLKDITKPLTTDNIATCRFSRVPFGIISSQFLLGATIKDHLESTKDQFSIDISKDMYVDNLITGANSEEEAKQLYVEAKQKLLEISMNLRDWKSNSQNLNETFSVNDRMNGTAIKVLGLQWNTNADQLMISTDKFQRAEISTTKRQVLMAVASLFDPLGYLTPTKTKMRLFLHNLWAQGKDWDDKIDSKDIEAWRAIIEVTKELSTITVPRYLGWKDPQLICFCDASEKVYATAVYLKTTHEERSVINLVFSKARVAPKNSMSIPRLELLALLIGVRSLNFISKQLGMQSCKKIIWTNSQCVLNWIKSKKPLSVFVQNRLKEITSDESIQFHYINTKENPADIATRGLSSQALKESTLWWKAPDWLKKDESSWPTWDIPPINNHTVQDIQSEIKERQILYETSVVANDTKISNISQPESRKLVSPFSIDESNYSSLIKILRITAYANRLVNRLKKNITPQGTLTSDNLKLHVVIGLDTYNGSTT